MWMPIATAPKHLKPILACDVNKGYESIMVHNGNEWECVAYNGLLTGTGFYPTHWMPLSPRPDKGVVEKESPVNQAAHNLLVAHTGKEGGFPQVNWYQLRSEISSVINEVINDFSSRVSLSEKEIS